MNDPVVLALTAALTGQENVELRVALGSRLLELGQASAALSEFERAISREPQHERALEGAANAARASGDAARASTYEAILAARGRAGTPRSPVRPLDAPSAPAGDEVGVAFDSRPAFPKPGEIRVVASDGQILEEELSEPTIGFDDVAGMQDVKDRLRRSFLNPLKNPDLIKRYGMTVGGGLLLYGPPGCGKTYLARALAGEIGARFLSIGLSDVLDMYFGESERKLHELFETARRRAPAVMFFDEVDALGQRRTQLKGAAGRNLVNQFLAEMDGFSKNNEGVFILGATNHPWDLDPAIRRPGRFDRLVLVTPPTLEARRRMFALSLDGKPLGRLDLDRAAKQTDGFSGADITAVAGLAVELAVEAAMSSGREVPIDDSLLKKAISDVRPSTRPWFETARNYALYANEGGVYDDLLAYLKKVGLG